MDRYQESGGVSSAPNPVVGATNQHFTDGDALTPATIPGAYWFEMVTESLRNVLTAAGLTPNNTDFTLLQKAILNMASDPVGTLKNLGGAYAADTLVTFPNNSVWLAVNNKLLKTNPVVAAATKDFEGIQWYDPTFSTGAPAVDTVGSPVTTTASNGNSIVICCNGSNTQLVKSTDDGATFSAITVDGASTAHISAVAFVTGTTWVAASSDGSQFNVYVSTNDGTSWTKSTYAQTGMAPYVRIDVLNSSEVMVIGGPAGSGTSGQGTFFVYSANAGSTWATKTIPMPSGWGGGAGTPYNLSSRMVKVGSVYMISSNMIHGSYQNYYWTSTDLTTWTERVPPNTSFGGTWLASNGTIAITNDGWITSDGINWTKYNVPLGAVYYDPVLAKFLKIVDLNGGTNGSAVSYSTDGIIWSGARSLSTHVGWADMSTVSVRNNKIKGPTYQYGNFGNYNLASTPYVGVVQYGSNAYNTMPSHIRIS